MCGLFGFVANTPSARIDLPYLQRIAIDTESRGPHSFGFAWLDSRNRLRMFKQVGRISRHLPLLQMVADARLLIGHTRYATHGEINEINAHPHACDGGWIVHNGQIFNYEDVQERYGLKPISDCDSETIGLLVEELDGTLMDRVEKAVTELANQNFAMMGLWKSPNKMIVARTGNPLHVSRERSGIYFASYSNELRNPEPLASDEIRAFSTTGGTLRESTRRIRRRHLV